MLCGLLRRGWVLVVLLAVIAAPPCAAGSAPKNIIFLIGDGMGIGPVTAARCAGPGRDGRLAMDTMPFTGLSITYSANALVTDSAASGTAMAAGVKTNNGMISVTPEGKPVKTILEIARDKGKSTGVVSTKFITDATPAVFAAHIDSRGKSPEIAVQMVAAKLNVILGGGRRHFAPKSAGGTRDDDRNLLDEAARSGYTIVDSAEAMQQATSDRIIGLFAPDSLTTEAPEPTIAEMTIKAISTLNKNPKGFFVMSEGGQIDSYAHGNKADGTVRQTLLFDDAVKAALDFAKKDRRTLVVVTADHDTGGLGVMEPNKDNPKFTAGWVTGGHTANMVPIFAYGPGAELFTGVHDNTDIPRAMAKLWRAKLN